MSNTFRVILLPRAYKDLDEITDYIKQDSPQNAAEQLDRIWKAAQSLDFMPARFKVHEFRRDPALTVHSMPVPPFIVYYRVDESMHVVRVLTIRRGQRRQPKRFR